MASFELKTGVREESLPERWCLEFRGKVSKTEASKSTDGCCIASCVSVCSASGGKTGWAALGWPGLDLEGLFRCDRRFFLLQLPTSSPIRSQQPSFSLHQVHTMH